ncbi:unnamed protein product [Callosobruchus maculatus]|uniref:Uncharacterized protein n=1 Tax=Callosobruchus maculatus TaxID=64391 RepID=A0A653D7B1_CALMS|nr:unnamed protein product [Callosobruchus maculatus]
MALPLWLTIFLIINAVISIIISVVWLCRKKKRILKFHKSANTDSTETKKLELKNGGIFITKILHHFENIPGRSESHLQDTASNDASKRFENAVLFIEADNQILRFQKEDLRRSAESLNTFYSVQPRSGSMGRKCSFESIISENI